MQQQVLFKLTHTEAQDKSLSMRVGLTVIMKKLFLKIEEKHCSLRHDRLQEKKDWLHNGAKNDKQSQSPDKSEKLALHRSVCVQECFSFIEFGSNGFKLFVHSKVFCVIFFSKDRRFGVESG